MQAMSLIIKGLTPGLTEVSKIKIGEKGRMINSAQGKQFQPPVKLDHFRVTTLQRGPDNNYLPDLVVHNLYGEKPRKLPVRLPYDDIELNFQSRYTCFLGKKLWCYGDGEHAERLANLNGNDGLRNSVACPCGRQEPTYTGNEKCKINSCLSVMIDGVETVGGVAKLRTTSFNSTIGILSSLALIKRLTGGPLAGLPLNLTLNPKTAIVPTTGQTSQVWVVGIEFAGRVEKLQEIAYQQASRQAAYAVKIEQIETEARKLIAAASVVDVETDATEIVEEFFPEQIDAELKAAGQQQRTQPSQGVLGDDSQVVGTGGNGIVSNGPPKEDNAPQPGSQAVTPAPESQPPAQAQEPLKHDPTKRRSRRNKHQVDREKWGGVAELVTCGSTPDQLEQIREATAAGDAAKEVVRTYLKKNIGYDQLSYLTEEEATELLGQLAHFSPRGGNVRATEDPLSPAGQLPQGQGDELVQQNVFCPIQGENVNVGAHCLNGCSTREADGFCPIVDDLGEQEVI